VFNPGERVEGYSNLLYVLLLAPVTRVAGPDAIYPVSVGLNLLFAAAAWTIFARLAARRLEPERAALAGLLFGICPAFWLWTASGMETPLFLLLQVALWAVVDRAEGAFGRPPALATVVVLSVLARADGFVPPMVAVPYLLHSRRRRAALVAGSALGVSMAALVAWRLAYYGYPLPNTYYAKVSGPVGERLLEGLLQLLGIVLHSGLLPHLAALLLAGVAAGRRPSPYPLPGGEGNNGTLPSNRLPFEVPLGLGWLAYWLYVGGDVFAERMLLVLFPIGILLLFDPALFPLRGRSLTAMATAIAVFQLLPLAIDDRFGYSLERYDRWVIAGRYLAQDRFAGRLLAVDAAGKIPFYSGLAAVDMLGLNDVHIAHQPARFFEAGHNKYDADYVLSRRPDLIADWIDPRRDLRFGLTRDKYEAAGYRLQALVFTRKHPGGGPALVEVGPGTDPGEVDVLIRRGYRYAVLVRR
jgi:arabinofuranosyltransferase